MVREIIIYKLKKNRNEIYWNAFINKSLPAMKEWNIQVLDYGFSMENPLIFHLIRSFNSLEHRNKSLDEFYHSDAWTKCAKNEIIESIESYKTTIFKS